MTLIGGKKCMLFADSPCVFGSLFDWGEAVLPEGSY